jgi:hypothetical protein
MGLPGPNFGTIVTSSGIFVPEFASSRPTPGKVRHRIGHAQPRGLRQRRDDLDAVRRHDIGGGGRRGKGGSLGHRSGDVPFDSVHGCQQ